MHPEAAEIRPAAGPVAGIGEPVLQPSHFAAPFVFDRAGFGVAGQVFPMAFVGPAGQGHGAAAVKQLAVRGGQWPAESPGLHLAEVCDAQGPEIGLHDVGASIGGQAGKDGGVGDRRKSGQLAPAHQPDGLAFAGAPGDRSPGRAGVGGGEFQRVSAEVIAAPKPDGERAAAGTAVLPQTADFVAGAFQRGEGPGSRAGIGVPASPRRDVEIGRQGGQGQDQPRTEHRPAQPAQPDGDHNCFIALSMAAKSWFMVASVSSPMFETRKVVPLILP